MKNRIKLFWYSFLLKITQRDLEYFDSDNFNSLGHFDKTRQKYVRRIKKLQNKMNELGGENE